MPFALGPEIMYACLENAPEYQFGENSILWLGKTANQKNLDTTARTRITFKTLFVTFVNYP